MPKKKRARNNRSSGSSGRTTWQNLGLCTNTTDARVRRRPRTPSCRGCFHAHAHSQRALSSKLCTATKTLYGLNRQFEGATVSSPAGPLARS